jgi:mRNA interferase RelE/StbE
MSYRIILAPAVVNELRKLDPPSRRRIQAAIELLADDPRPPAAIQLVGGSGEWRVRTGDFRIIYEIDDGELRVLVLRAGHRREVYRGR